MTRIILELAKSLEENASYYYERSKRSKKKLVGVKEILDKAYLDLARIEINIKEEEEQALPLPERKKEWYEKFRWFYTSTGYLVLGGRDATTNEIVIKKHTDAHDLIFHTDMAGSPFFILKTEGKEPDASTLREVADATCTFSRAFKLGLARQSVFYATPDQVTKEANAGEYLTKGAFMIRGKTNYLENNINCAIGVYQGKIMCGPVAAISFYCPTYLFIEQGDKKPSEAAKLIKKQLKHGELDEIIRVLPSGNITVKANTKSMHPKSSSSPKMSSSD